MDERRDKLIKRIAKLLRRAERDDGHEADTARVLAEKLMSKYGVDVELDEADIGPNPSVHQRIVMFLWNRQDEPWSQFLLQEFAPMYSCVHWQDQGENGGWLFHIQGSPAQVELCAIHFEYLRRRIQVMASALCKSMDNPLSPFPLTQRVQEAIHWGVMDGMRQRLIEKTAGRVPDVSPPTDTHTVTTIPNHLALPSAENVSVRGNEIAVRGADDDPIKLEFELPPDVSVDEPPRWAWNIGFTAVTPQIDPEPPEIVYAPVSRLAISADIAGALGAEDVRIVAQLVRMRPSSILQVPGLGEREVILIIQALSDHGLLLAPEWEDAVS